VLLSAVVVEVEDGIRLDYIRDTLISLGIYAVVCMALLLGSYWLLDMLTPGHLTRIIKDGGWNAALLAASNLVAVALIIVFAMLGQPVSLAGIVTATVFAIAGTLFQALGLWIIRKVWFGSANFEAVLHERVTPVGVFLAAAAFALGLSLAVAVH